MFKKPKKNLICWWSVLVFCFLSAAANAQSLPCELLLIEAVNDTFLVETDRKKILVRTDKGEERMVRDAACVNISRPGFYQILTGVENSIGQLNESFYLTIRHEDGSVSGAKNPNAGLYKVVRDLDTVKGPPGTKIDTTRDAGLFYLLHGNNTIVLNHYYLIQNEYPDFLNPLNEGIKPANVESVHLFKLEFIFIEARSHDLLLSKSASVDTVEPGEQFSYTLKIENLGPNTSRNITLTDTIPEFLVVDESSFSVAPNSLTKSANQTLVVWNLASLEADLTADISYFVRVEDSDFLPESQFEVVNTSSVVAKGDTNLFNNFASSAVVVKKPVLLTDISVSQFVKTDSFSVQGADTLWFVKPGDTFSYFINIANQSDIEAFNVVLKDILPDSVSVANFASRDTIDWPLGNLQPFRDTTFTFEATLSINVGEELTELTNTVIVQADNEDPLKLDNNISTATETVFIIPPTILSESCELLTLDFNVYQPQSGAPLGITFELNTSRKVQLDVYDMGGAHVMKLAENRFNEGLNRFEWFGLTESGRKVGSGVYIITLLSDNLICWKKVIIAR
ncbi:DUF11 domain-containing protein [candidate division KSB1 bacterium]|nr:DUF11 domain-containing protein [candidate division KSB1 bacterium]